MRGGKLINIDDYEILKNNKSTLKETSKDMSNKDKTLYMTESLKSVVNFDDVKSAYVKNLCISEIPKSNDALFINDRNNLVFVEFKNGFMGKPEKKFAVRKKIYDSIIILTDILNVGISRLRDNMEYILVYNEEDNRNENDVMEKKSIIQSSKSFDSIAKKFSSYAKKEYVCFGVKIFENYCFHKVHTYTEAEFENYLKTNCQSFDI